MSTDATTGEDLHADQHDDPRDDVREQPQRDALTSAATADDSTQDRMDEPAEYGGEPADDSTGKTATVLPNDAASAQESVVGGADEATTPSVAIALPETTTEEPLATTDLAEQVRESDVAREAGSEPVVTTHEEQKTLAPQEPTQEGAPEVAGNDHAGASDASDASDEAHAGESSGLIQPLADGSPAQLDPSDQPTEIGLTVSDLVHEATPESSDVPYTWSEEPTLPDPAYSPPDIPDAAHAEPWMISAVSPDYVPTAVDARTGTPAQSRPYPSAQYPSADYPPANHPSADYPQVVYPLPAQRGSPLPLIGVLAAVLLAALVVGLFVHNAMFVAQPPASNMLYSSTMTTASTMWPRDTACFFGKDGYHIVGANNCYYSGSQYQDATTTVTAKVLKGPSTAGYGIAFRRPSPNNYYIFLVTDNGDWFVMKGNSALQRATPSAAIKSGIGATNVLAVRMQGAHFTFFANGTQLGALTDDTYSTGYIGLSGDVNTEVVYHNISVTRP